MNFIWKITGGIIFAFLWLILGIVLSITIIFYHEGVKCFKIAYFVFKPFGREVELNFDDNMLKDVIFGIILGVIMGILSIFWLLTLTISILGIPLIYQWIKVMKVSIFPFAAEIM